MSAAALGGCATGARADFRPEETSVGDPAVDAVLSRVLGIGDAVYTATYESVVVYDGASVEVSATQASPVRHSLTVGDVRYLVDVEVVVTCQVTEGECRSGHDPALVSNSLLAQDFFATNVAARLRRDFGLAVGPPTTSTEEFEGNAATCVTIPLAAPPSAPQTSPQSVYCVLDNGVLTRLDATDLQVTMTSYSTTPDESLLER